MDFAISFLQVMIMFSYFILHMHVVSYLVKVGARCTILNWMHIDLRPFNSSLVYFYSIFIP